MKKRNKFRDTGPAHTNRTADLMGNPDQPDPYDVVVNITRTSTDNFLVDLTVPEVHSSYLTWSKELVGRHIADVANSLRELSHGGPRLGAAIKQLEIDGMNYFSDIFENTSIREIIRSKCDSSTPPRILFYSDEFFFPWEVLHLGSNTGNIHDFLGFRARITRIVRQPKGRTNIIGNMSWPATGKYASIGWCSTLSSVVTKELPYMRSLKDRFSMAPGGSSPSIHEIGQLNGNEDPLENVKAFFDEISNAQAPILHLACHAENGPTDRNRYFQVRNRTKISHSSIKRYLEKEKIHPLIHNPFVFFNACEASVADPKVQNYFPKLYFSLGARSFLAPQCIVNGSFAAQFAEQFYNEWSKGPKQLGEALLDARLNSLSSGNPASLAYALYGQEEPRFLEMEEAQEKETS